VLFDTARDSITAFWQNAGIMKWEYMRLAVTGNEVALVVGPGWAKLNFEDPTDALNDFGEQGWEVVGIASGDNLNIYTVLLKRPKQ
jgi:hypothetical protein